MAITDAHALAADPNDVDTVTNFQDIEVSPFAKLFPLVGFSFDA